MICCQCEPQRERNALSSWGEYLSSEMDSGDHTAISVHFSIVYYNYIDENGSGINYLRIAATIFLLCVYNS